MHLFRAASFIREEAPSRTGISASFVHSEREIQGQIGQTDGAIMPNIVLIARHRGRDL
jgi:hypothetical protein